jgi:hypothetical protein
LVNHNPKIKFQEERRIQMLQDLPIILKPTTGRRIFLVMAALVMAALGGLMLIMAHDRWMNAQGPAMIVLVLGAVFIVCSGMAVLNAFRSSLVMHAQGFVVQTAFRVVETQWQDVEGPFQVVDVENAKLVCWRLRSDAPRSAVRRALRNLHFDGSLAAIFGGLSGEALAERMNQLRELHGQP